MVAAFPSKSEIEQGEFEDVHHYYWFSLLRPLMGEGNPEVFMTVDHASPPNAISFYTSTEGELESPPHDPNAPAPAPPTGMSGMNSGGPEMGMGMGGGTGGRMVEVVQRWKKSMSLRSLMPLQRTLLQNQQILLPTLPQNLSDTAPEPTADDAKSCRPRST